jgi:hypothetical protein
MSSLHGARIPIGRWSEPEDNDWDKYYNEFEAWLNDNYDMESQSIAGRSIPWEQAFENEDLLNHFIELFTDRRV